jgi:photosystem II stability/assembly factor-like uncharacterized protein
MAVVATVGAPSAVGAASPAVAFTTQVSRTPALPASCLDRHGGPPSSDGEPTIAVDPKNDRHIAVTWWLEQQNVFGARAVGIAVSRNGGAHWRRSLARGVDSCTGNPAYWRAGAHDPAISFGLDDRLYLATESGRVNPQDPSDVQGIETDWGLVSGDGGNSWSGPVPQMQGSLTFGNPDQDTVTADPEHPGVAYLMAEIEDPSDLTAVGRTITGKAYFSRTNDGGRTWSSPVLAYVPAGVMFRAPYGHRLHVLADGTLLDIFSEWNGSAAVLGPAGTNYPVRVYAIRSSDGGNTWSVPIPITEEIGELSAGFEVSSPAGSAQWEVAPTASSALAPDRRTLYVAWHDNLQRAQPVRSTLHLARSSDGGLTWTQLGPITASTTAFDPTIAVAGDGTVGVTWYDLREQRPGEAAWPLDVYFASSTDRGQTWHEQKIAGPMNLLTEQPHFADAFVAGVDVAPGGLWIGDYFGLAGLRHGFAAAYTVTKPLATDGPSDIFYSEIADAFAGTRATHHHGRHHRRHPHKTRHDR